MTAAKSPGAVAALGASERDGLGQHVNAETSHPPGIAQAPIRAELIRSDRCSALGITATGYAPVLGVCRLLVEAGYHPAASLEAYRGEVLCLRVRSIGEGARLTVEDDWHGQPRLRPWRDRRARCGAASPVALIGQKVTQPPALRKSMCEAAP